VTDGRELSAFQYPHRTAEIGPFSHARSMPPGGSGSASALQVFAALFQDGMSSSCDQVGIDPLEITQ
jgi:hypothetical protein